MSRYKDYPIYGVAVPAPSIGGTHGVLFSIETWTRQRKLNALNRPLGRSRQETGRRIRAWLCKDWIDKRP